MMKYKQMSMLSYPSPKNPIGVTPFQPTGEQFFFWFKKKTYKGRYIGKQFELSFITNDFSLNLNDTQCI